MRRMKDKIEGSITNADYANSAGSVAWSNVSGKPGTFTPAAHTHDDRYYTESEMNSKLNGKAESIVLASDANLNNVTTPGFYSCGGSNSIANKPSGTGAIGLIVTHNASGTYYTQILTTSSNANTYRRTCSNGTWSAWAQDKYTDTNTWRGIQNNLTSDSTDQSLSAAQGKALKTLVDGKAPSEHTHNSIKDAGNNSSNTTFAYSKAGMNYGDYTWLAGWNGYELRAINKSQFAAKSHTHTKSQITDFPTSMPASDVSSWAKAATKPSYTKAEVGLSNVDNTADKDKSVKYATNAASATNAQCLNNDSQYMKFHWSGKDGQPNWLWGGNDASNMYVYNPKNFSVNYATTAGTALTAKNLPYSITYEGSYVGTASYDGSVYSDDKNYATETNPVRTTLSKEYDVVVFVDAEKNGMWDTSDTCPEKYAFLRLMDINGLFIQSYVVMSALTNEWTRGKSYDKDNSDGPIIEYKVSPKASIKYRKNGTSIERYWTREELNPSWGVNLGAPGSATYISNGAYQLLDRGGITYHVFGIDIDHHIFISNHTDDEGSEVV